MIKSYNECTEQPLKSHLTRVALTGKTSYLVKKLGFKPNISGLKNTFVKRRGSDFSRETNIGIYTQKYKYRKKEGIETFLIWRFCVKVLEYSTSFSLSLSLPLTLPSE